MERVYTIKLFVNQKLAQQTRCKQGEYKRIIQRWKKIYALQRHNYEIYLYLESKMKLKI